MKSCRRHIKKKKKNRNKKKLHYLLPESKSYRSPPPCAGRHPGRGDLRRRRRRTPPSRAHRVRRSSRRFVVVYIDVGHRSVFSSLIVVDRLSVLHQSPANSDRPQTVRTRNTSFKRHESIPVVHLAPTTWRWWVFVCKIHRGTVRVALETLVDRRVYVRGVRERSTLSSGVESCIFRDSCYP